MPANIDLFKSENMRRTEERQRTRMFYLFSGIAIPYLLAYGVFDYLDARGGVHIVIGAIEHLLAFLLLLSVARYYKHSQLSVLKPLITVLMMIMLLVSMFDGGISGTAIYWLFVFPPAAFYLNGYKPGIFYNTLFFVCSVAYLLLQRAGIIPAFYSMEQLVQMLFVLLQVFLISFAAQFNLEKFRVTIISQREHLRVLLGGLPVGITMVVAPDGRLSTANPSAERLFGRTIEPNVKAADFPKTYQLAREDGTPYPAEDLPLTVALMRGESTVKNDVFVKRPDGSHAVLRVSAAPVRDETGRIVSAVAVWEDATKEHEISRMKSDFISLASHQLRTPLTSIKWSIEMAADEENGPLSQAQKEALDFARRSTIRLVRLVSDLLNVSRIERGQIALQPELTDLDALCREAVAEINPTAVEKGLALENEVRALGQVRLDPKLIFQALLNLLANAVKYTPKGGHIEVGGRRGANEVEMFVRDSGVGIPAEAKDKIFQKFFRADNVSVDNEGTGLGLYLVKAIIESSGGRVWFESEVGKGTTFWFSLPISGVAAKEGSRELII
ncbi:MAG: ATP-binding protein [Patescibacteria group bacterium]|nr:ATP-binding protein [Patescibacteria group bacterium]